MATELISANVSGETKQRPAARYATATARILMGLIFFVFGVNGFFMFLHPPANAIPAAALAFNIAMAKTGYMIKLVSATQMIAGVLLLSNRYVPLAIAIIAPVIVNIIFFHLFLDPEDILGPAIIVLALEIYLVWVYRELFKPMLVARATPK